MVLYISFSIGVGFVNEKGNLIPFLYKNLV